MTSLHVVVMSFPLRARSNPPFCPSFSSDMPLHVRRSSDPALMTINGPYSGGESRVQTEEPPSRKNPTRWSTTAGFLKARHSSGTNSLERKVSDWLLESQSSVRLLCRETSDTLLSVQDAPQLSDKTRQTQNINYQV